MKNNLFFNKINIKEEQPGSRLFYSCIARACGSAIDYFAPPPPPPFPAPLSPSLSPFFSLTPNSFSLLSTLFFLLFFLLILLFFDVILIYLYINIICLPLHSFSPHKPLYLSTYAKTVLRNNFFPPPLFQLTPPKKKQSCSLFFFFCFCPPPPTSFHPPTATLLLMMIWCFRAASWEGGGGTPSPLSGRDRMRTHRCVQKIALLPSPPPSYSTFLTYCLSSSLVASAPHSLPCPLPPFAIETKHRTGHTDPFSLSLPFPDPLPYTRGRKSFL